MNVPPRLRRVTDRWLSDTAALPIDVFRVAVGLLACAYFARLFVQVPDFSGPDGLLDHVMLREIWTFARWTLLPVGLPDAFFYALYGAAVAASLGVVLGVTVKPCAGFLFVVASCAYRHNFAVMSVDDVIVHLLLLWLLLLPVGRTLRLLDLRADPGACLRTWARVRVPGLALRCLLVNLGGIWLIAGLWKLGSPMWRDGFALYAVLRLPIAFAPDAVQPHHLPFVRVLSHLALASEFLLPLCFAAPRAWRLKWLGLVLALGFHGGILLTLPIPLANLALLASMVLFFRDEWMGALERRLALEPIPTSTRRTPSALEIAALALVIAVYLATAPSPLRRPAQVALWAVGVAQNYRLFNWIDSFNYSVHTGVAIQAPDGIAVGSSEDLVPDSLGGALLTLNMVGKTWLPMPNRYRRTLADGIRLRAEARFCRRTAAPGWIRWWADVQRITPNNAALKRPRRKNLARFRCDEATLPWWTPSKRL